MTKDLQTSKVIIVKYLHDHIKSEVFDCHQKANKNLQSNLDF
jgi:hypothetical protein